MMQWITSFTAWFQIIITLSFTIVGFVTYRQPHYHNTRTILALAALTFLTLTELLLVLAQAYLLLPTRPLSPGLLSALSTCVMLIYMSEFLLRNLQGRRWNIARVCIALFYIAFIVITAIGYVYNL